MMDMDLSHLSEKERAAILQVIKRDEDLRRKEEQRLHRLKAELHWLRKRGALKSGFDPEHSCIRCRTELGKLLNRGAPCPGCQGKVCKSCRIQSPEDEEDWVCIVCHKQMEIQAASGEWMNEFIRRPSRRRDNKVFVPPSDVVKHSIRRSWTVAEGYRRDTEVPGTLREKSSSIHPSYKQSFSREPSPKNLSPKRPSSKSSSPKSSPVSSSSHSSSPHSQAHKAANGRLGIQCMSLITGDIIVSPDMEPHQTTHNGNSTQMIDKGSPIPVPSSRAGSALPDYSAAQVDADDVSLGSSPHDILRLTPSPRHLSSSPSPRESRSIPSPVLPLDSSNGTSSPIPSPRQRSSPLQRQTMVSESERTSIIESPEPIATHQSQYMVHREIIHKSGDFFDSGYDNQGSPRTSRSSEHSRQSSGISTSHTDSRDPTADSFSGGSDGSDSEDLETSGVVFHKVTLRKRKENMQKGKHLNDGTLISGPFPFGPSWGQTGGANSLPRAKTRTIHSICTPFYQYSVCGPCSWGGGKISPNTSPVRLGSSLTLPCKTEWSKQMENTFKETHLLDWTKNKEGPFVYRTADVPRRTPTGSPIIKRIRRSQQKSLEKGRCLRSPDFFIKKETLPYNHNEEKSADCSENDMNKISSVSDSSIKKSLGSSSWEDIRDVNLEFEDDFPIILRNCNNDSGSDIFFNITDKIIPEGDDYKLVFISSSSSKSSGLNSLAGSCEDVSVGSSSPQVPPIVNTDEEMMVYIEDGEWNSQQKNALAETSCVTFSKDDKLLLTSNVCSSYEKDDIAKSEKKTNISATAISSTPATYQEIVESLSPTHSVEEVETIDHIISIDNISSDSSNIVKDKWNEPTNEHVSSPFIFSYPLDSADNTQENVIVTDKEHSKEFLLGSSYSEIPSSKFDSSFQMLHHPNNYFSRSDSTRSSGERSIEEVSFCDHVFPYSCDTKSSDFIEYKSILNEIYSYMSQSCDKDKVSANFTDNAANNSLVNLHLTDWKSITLPENSNVCSCEHHASDCKCNLSAFLKNQTASRSSPFDKQNILPEKNNESEALPTYLLNETETAEQIDESDIDNKEWTYKVDERELSSMTLQVNFSDVESQADVCSLDANIEVQSVHCNVEDDTLSTSTYLDDGSLDSSLINNNCDISDSEPQFPTNTNNSFQSGNLHSQSDKSLLISTEVLSLSESVAVDKPHNIGNIQNINEHNDSSKETQQTDSQVNNNSETNEDCNIPCSSILSCIDPIAKEYKPADVSETFTGSKDGDVSIKSTLAADNGCNDIKEFLSLEIVDYSQTRLKNKKSGSEIEHNFFQSKEITIPYLKTDNGNYFGDKERLSELPSEFSDISEPTTDFTASSSGDLPEKDAGNLVYYLAPQGTQSIYLVKSDSEKASTSDLETSAPDDNTIATKLPIPKSPENSMLIEISSDETFSSDDRLESDTDSQDTVIEGESYKRMRQLAIQKKIIEANEELNVPDLLSTSENVKKAAEETELNTNLSMQSNEHSEESASQPLKDHAVCEISNNADCELVENETQQTVIESEHNENKLNDITSLNSDQNTSSQENLMEDDFKNKKIFTSMPLSLSKLTESSNTLENNNENTVISCLEVPSGVDAEKKSDFHNQTDESECFNFDCTVKKREEIFVIPEPTEMKELEETLADLNINQSFKVKTEAADPISGLNESQNTSCLTSESQDNSSNSPSRFDVSKSLEKLEKSDVLVKSEQDQVLDYINRMLEILILAASDSENDKTSMPSSLIKETLESSSQAISESEATLNSSVVDEIKVKINEDIHHPNVSSTNATDFPIEISAIEKNTSVIKLEEKEEIMENIVNEKQAAFPLNELLHPSLQDNSFEIASSSSVIINDELKTECNFDKDAEQETKLIESSADVIVNETSFSSNGEIIASIDESTASEILIDKNGISEPVAVPNSKTTKSEACSDQEHTVSVDISHLQELIAQSKKLSESSNRHSDSCVNDNSSSVLEKYYTLSLGSIDAKSNVGTKVNSAKFQGKLEDYFETLGNSGRKSRSDDVDSINTEDDNVGDGSSTEVDSCSEAVSEQWEFEASEKLDESIEESDTTFSDSASSDEANFDREEELRGFSRTIDFSLHTIIEESCEESESERERRQKNQTPQPVDSSDLEKYFNFTIGNTTLPLMKRHSLAEESECSDSFSETSSSVCSESLQQFGEDIDPAILASNRLEKYFMTGFLGLEHSMSEDANGTDESGSVGSCSECSSITASASGSPSLERRLLYAAINEKQAVDKGYKVSEIRHKKSSASANVNEEKEGILEEDSNEAPFEKNDGFDTIKRKKKSKSDSSCLCAEDRTNDFPSKNMTGLTVTEEIKEPLQRKLSSGSKGNDMDSLLNQSNATEDCNSITVENKLESNCEETTDEFPKDEEKDKCSNSLQQDSEKDKNSIDASVNDCDSTSNLHDEAKDQKVGFFEQFPIYQAETETPLPDSIVVGTSNGSSITQLNKQVICGLDRKQQSRDSGFIGSSDDLLKDSADTNDEVAFSDVGKDDSNLNKTADSNSGNSNDILSNLELDKLSETSQVLKKKVLRENSNSDDEAMYIVGQLMDQISKGFAMRLNGSPLLPRAKPPDLVAFETELTKLMQTVPGVEVTVKEIVEELSSTDYYSDSYESSDYTSSDHEGPIRVSMLRHSLRSSLRSNEESRLHFNKEGATGLMVAQDVGAQELPNVDNSVPLDSDMPMRDETNSPFTRETIYIYEKLMSSLNRMTEQASKENSDNELPGNQSPSSTRSHPPMAVQVLNHIKDRLTSLMREVHTADGTHSTKIRRNNSSSSSSSWLGAHHHHHHLPLESSSNYHKNEPETGKNYMGSLHADITRWLAKQPFNSGDEQSISSTSSINYESEDSPTDTEIDSDDVTNSPSFPHKDKKPLPVSLTKLDKKNGSDITIVDDDLSFRSLDTPETLFATHKIGEEVNPFGLEVKDKQLIESSLHCLKTLQDRGVMDLQYFVTQGNNNEYEVWQSLVIDEEKFKADSLGSVAGTKGLENENRPLSRTRHLLDSLKSSSSDTLQCISEEDLDSKPSSSRTSIIGSSTNIWSSQSSLADKRGSLETLGCFSDRYSQSPLPGVSPETDGLRSSLSVSSKENLIFRKTPGLVTVDIPLKEKDMKTKFEMSTSSKYQQNRSSFHTEILDSGKISFSKDKVDFRSSLHLWVDKKELDSSNKPTARAMSADPLPQDCDWSNSRPFVTCNKSSLAKQNHSLPFSAVARTRPKAMIMSDNQLDKQLVVQNRYSTLTKSGPISVSPLSLSDDNVDPSRPKASTLPRIGADVHANISFLHNNHGNHKTNTPPPPTAVPPHLKWNRSHQGELQNRKEIRSWPAEDTNLSLETSSPSKSSTTRRLPKPGIGNTLEGKTISIPQISISDITELNPSGRSSYGSHGTSSDRESIHEEDIDRIVALHKTRSSLSSFGTRSDSMTSVYSAAGGGRYGTVVVRGEVLFSLRYNYKAGALEIMVKQCRDLAAVDTKRNRSDPYVKIYLLPDKSKSGKRKTKVKKHTLNPTFEEMLKFSVTISELETRTLWLTVWHSDMFGRNDFLGEVMLPLGYDVFDDPSPKWYPLQERLGPPEELVTYKGELNLSLTYMPPDVTTQKKGKQGKGSLHVLVKDARNLTAVRANGTSDPFCKSYLLPDKGKASKQKTPVIKKNCNPKWNHTFVYEDVSLDDLADRCLELTIWDYDRLTSNDFLGGVRLSLGTGKYQGKEVDWMDSRGDEVALWQSMLDRPNSWVEGTLLLQPSMEKRL